MGPGSPRVLDCPGSWVLKGSGFLRVLSSLESSRVLDPYFLVFHLKVTSTKRK